MTRGVRGAERDGVDTTRASLRGFRVTLISTYEMGRQPFGLASPAAWLRERGADVTCLDLSRDKLFDAAIETAHLVAFYVPMHTATRMAVDVIKRVVEQAPQTPLCAYGLYAPLNAAYLRALGVDTVIGGEFEEELVLLCERLAGGERREHVHDQPPAFVSTARLHFRVPDRRDLPPLDRYARLQWPDGRLHRVGYTEATRGCKHLCRHCPIVPVYNGRFRIVAPEVVLADIARQVEAGAQHITFGDPDFFNSVKHAAAIVTPLHQEFPDLTYDVTIKVEHLLKHRDAMPMLRETGCAFVVSAVESVDDRTLRLLDKGHTRADVVAVACLFREQRLALVPTFVAFTPWTTIESYADLLGMIAELDLVEHVAPIQLAIRLLVPTGSRLLVLPEIQALCREFDQGALMHPWQHPDPRVDALQSQIESLVQQRLEEGAARPDIFDEVCERVQEADRAARSRLVSLPPRRARSTIPYLTEPWYC
jgi:hypothetical protein